MKKCTLFLLSAISLFAAALDFEAEGKLWWAHIQFLADDRLAGRNTGSEGYKKAAEYVAAAFARFGLKPAGTLGYSQPVQFETRQLVEEESRLALVREGIAETLAREDASLNTRGDPAPALEAPMVFVGYGLAVPEAHFDELAGMNLRGKIAVYVNGAGPVETTGNIKSHYSSAVERWNTLKKAGAVGVATIQSPRGVNGQPPQTPPAGERDGRGATPPQPSFALADPNLQEMAGMALSVTIARQGIDKFFEGTGHSAEEILKAAAANEALPKFALNGTLRSRAAIKRDRVEAPNVIGMLPGSDEERLKLASSEPFDRRRPRLKCMAGSFRTDWIPKAMRAEPSGNLAKLLGKSSKPVLWLVIRVESTVPSEFNLTTPKCEPSGIPGGFTSVKRPPTIIRPSGCKFNVIGVPRSPAEL